VSLIQPEQIQRFKWAPAAIWSGIFALALFFATKIGLLWMAYPENMAAVWPASGISLAVLLLNRRKNWGVLLAMIFTATALGCLASGNAWNACLGLAFAHTLESAVCAWIFTWILKGEITFEKLADVFVLFLVAALGTAITALAGALVPALTQGTSFWNAWWLWLNEDSVSMLVLTPLMITFWRRGKSLLKQDIHLWIEFCIVLFILAFFTGSIFGIKEINLPIVPHAYMLFPWLIWTSLRFKTPGATFSFLLVALITLGCTLSGNSAFPMGGQNPTDRLKLVYLFLGGSSLTNLLQTAIFATLQNTQKELRKSERELKTAQQVSHVGSWNWDINQKQLEWSDEMYCLYGLERATFKGSLTDLMTQSAHPDDREKGRQFTRNLMEHRTSASMEHRVIWPDGSIHVLWTKIGELVLDSDGQPIFLNGISQDITERKAAEEQLAFTQFAIDHSTDAAYWMKSDGHFVYVNYRASQVLGYTTHELLQMTIFDIDPRLTQQVWEENWQARKSIPKTRHRCKDGTIFPVEVHGNYVEYGGVLYKCSFARDISEREAAEAALQDSENRFRTLYENSPISIWEEDFSEVKAIFDALTAAGTQNFRAYFEAHSEAVQRCAAAVKIIDCNLQTVRFFGAKDKQEVIIDLPHYFAEESYAVFKEEMIALAEGHTTFEAEIPVNHSNGKDIILMIYLNVIPGCEQTLSRVLVSFIDITERKRVEKALFKALNENRASLDFLQNILDTSPSIICWKDRTSRFLGCNSAYARLFGLSKPEDIIGKTDWDIPGSPEQKELYLAADRRIMDSGQPEYHIIENGQDANGNLIWFDTNKLPLRNAAGEVIGILVTIQDITAQKTVQDEIQQLNAELEQRVEYRTAQLQTSNQELESFSYSVSHDLRAPLRSINGFSQIILEEYADRLDDTGRAYFNQILSASQRMGQLIENLLKLSKVTRSSLQLSQVDLCALAREICANLQQDHPDREVQIIIPEKLVVHADESLMRVVLDNLIGNAWKFTGKTLDARIELGSFEQDQKKVYFVRDNGAGFDMAFVNKLFGTFQRLHSDKEFAGTGVGLALSQRIIRRHNGTIWAEGLVNHGAVFYFTLHDLTR
jgi:PAS domain S-box-containing protein